MYLKTKNLNLTILIFFILSILFLFINELSYAYPPYKSYTYNFWEEVVSAPQAYLPSRIIEGKDLGVDSLANPQDLFVSNNYIYILDTGNNRIIILDQDWNQINIIEDFNNNGKVDKFNSPRGFFITETEKIYIADTNNSRIIELDNTGKFIREIGPPQSDFETDILENIEYRPEQIVVNPNGQIFVLARHVYEGLIELKIDGSFRGFVGAPRVTPNPVDLFWRRIATEEQRARMTLFLPTEFSSLSLDSSGFIYVTEGNTIRKLNPGGDNILRTEGFFPPQGDLPSMFRDGDRNPSHFVDIIAREDGSYSVLDQERGRIFTYDINGNLLYVFGGIGNQKGTFRNPVALEMINNKILVLDRRKNWITIFKPTEYAKLIHTALYYHELGEYDKSVENWNRVLRKNLNYDLAYTGIARTYLREDQFQKSMNYFKLANNRPNYSQAYSLYRREIINENFGKIIIVILLITILLFMFNKYKMKISKMKQEQLAASSTKINEKQETKSINNTWKSLYYSLYLSFHPFKGFWDLKHEKKGSISASLIILGLVSLTYIFMRQYTGFIFNSRDLTQLNIYSELTSVLIPFILWCVVNWCLTTLMDGKGSFKDIVIASAFALTPIILLNIPSTIISNYLVLEEGAFFLFFQTLAVVWSVTLLFIGTMVTHDYDIAKTSLTVILIIVGMATILFIGLLFFSLIDLVTNFIYEFYAELVLRL